MADPVARGTESVARQRRASSWRGTYKYGLEPMHAAWDNWTEELVGGAGESETDALQRSNPRLRSSSPMRERGESNGATGGFL